jgi:DNA polymerase IIIc chi subunit
MMFVRQTPWLLPHRASAIPQADNLLPSLTTQQISQIARIFDSTVEDELAKARTAWTKYQSTRKRDAVYGYLSAIFEIVVRWKEQRPAKSSSHRALNASKQDRAVRTDEPFAVVIFCTSDSRKVDAKTRSKWSRALKYTERFKPDTQGLAQFIKSKGGINEYAAQWSDRLR